MQTIIFDMYGVIIEESKGNFLPYTYSHFPESEYERLTRQFRQEQLFTRTGNGELTSAEFLSQLGYSDPDFSMRDYLENHLTLDPGFIPFAEKYAGAYRLALLSNDVAAWSEHLTRFHGLDRFFAEKIISGDAHLRKPQREIFELALSRLGARGSDCIFIDNDVKNLDAAEACGICPILFNRDGVSYSGHTVNSFAELDALFSSGAF